jgi:hypothetical protein
MTAEARRALLLAALTSAFAPTGRDVFETAGDSLRAKQPRPVEPAATLATPASDHRLGLLTRIGGRRWHRTAGHEFVWRQRRPPRVMRCRKAAVSKADYTRRQGPLATGG